MSLGINRFFFFFGGSDGKESACYAGDSGLNPGSGGSSGGGHGNLLHHFCMENSMDKGAWWSTNHRVTKIQT